MELLDGIGERITMMRSGPRLLQRLVRQQARRHSSPDPDVPGHWAEGTCERIPLAGRQCQWAGANARITLRNMGSAPRSYSASGLPGTGKFCMRTTTTSCSGNTYMLVAR